MKKIIQIFILLTMFGFGLLFLTGCSEIDYTNEHYASSFKDTGRFVEIYNYNNGYHIYYDKETMVEYVAAGGNYFTMLVNADGTPYLYEGR